MSRRHAQSCKDSETEDGQQFSGHKQSSRTRIWISSHLECSENQGGFLVEPMGFEPTTSSMPSRRAPNCATAPPGNTSKVYHTPPGTQRPLVHHTLRDRKSV